MLDVVSVILISITKIVSGELFSCRNIRFSSEVQNFGKARDERLNICRRLIFCIEFEIKLISISMLTEAGFCISPAAEDYDELGRISLNIDDRPLRG